MTQKTNTSKPVDETRTTDAGEEVKPPQGTKPVTFVLSYGVYNPLETAGFQEARANEIVKAGFAVEGADKKAAERVMQQRAAAAGNA